MRFKNVFFLLFLVTLFSFQLLSAQTAGTGALTGTIKDPSGAVVPNATVTLTSSTPARRGRLPQEPTAVTNSICCPREITR